MAIDSFLVFDGKSPNGIEVKGETQDDVYVKKSGIEVFSWSWGASNPVTIGSSSAGHGAGKVSVSALAIMKKVDTASPMLFLACAKGEHFPKVTLEVRKSGTGAGDPYQIFEMTDVFVESIQQSAASEEGTESVSLAYATITMKYSPQGKDGKLGTAIPAGWDVTTNKQKS